MNRDDGSERMICFDEKRCHVIQHGIFYMIWNCFVIFSYQIQLLSKKKWVDVVCKVAFLLLGSRYYIWYII